MCYDQIMPKLLEKIYQEVKLMSRILVRALPPESLNDYQSAKAIARSYKKILRRYPMSDKWFWSSAWQKKEAEADEAIRSGKVSPPFSDHKKLLLALKRERK